METDKLWFLYNSLQPLYSKKDWVVWHGKHIPKHAMALWIALLCKHKTNSSKETFKSIRSVFYVNLKMNQTLIFFFILQWGVFRYLEKRDGLGLYAWWARDPREAPEGKEWFQDLKAKTCLMIAVAATVWHLWHERNQSLFQTKKTTKFTILENLRRLDQRSGAGAVH